MLRLLLLATALCACAPALAQVPADLTAPGQLPPSTGFADPDDISVLLDYRLPDWWSRVWTANVDLSGVSASMSPSSGEDRQSTHSDLELGSHALWEFDGERRQGQFTANMAAQRRANHNTGDEGESQWRGGAASASASGIVREYLDERWFLRAGANGAWQYEEIVNDPLQGDEARAFSRFYAASFTLGGGCGRLRNVTPAIRAARLNERLVALGHDPLSAGAVQQVAAGLTRQGAYANVFARPDRRFWADVLAPVSARDELSPYETYYLAEVLAENVGERYEGWQVDLHARIGYDHGDPYGDETWTISPELAAAWSHNFSRDHQLSVDADVTFDRFASSNDHTLDAVEAAALVEYLWCVADRVLWTTSARGRFSYQDSQGEGVLAVERSRRVTLDTSCSIYVEDRLSLRPRATWSFYQLDLEGEMNVDRRLEYSLAFAYDLDRTLN